MKKITFLFLVLLTISCSKEEDNTIYKTKEIKINLSNTLFYQYYLGRFIEEDEAEITTQALHFEISEFYTNESNGNISYKYKPQLGFEGEDYVEILTERTINIENGQKEIITLKLIFNIL